MDNSLNEMENLSRIARKLFREEAPGRWSRQPERIADQRWILTRLPECDRDEDFFTLGDAMIPPA
jgi:hypothetical protein